MRAFEYITAESFESATRFLSEKRRGDALVKAGGIDVLDRLKERIDAPKQVLSLHALRNGDGGKLVRMDGQSVVIDALAKVAEVAAHETVRQKLPALAKAALDAATPQIRNVATVGGNLCQKPRCWYFRSHDFHCLKKGGGTCYAVEGDNRYHAIFGAGACHIVHPSNLAVPLMAYGARVRLIKFEDGKQTEREVAMDDFFRVPANPQDDENVLEFGELVREVIVPVTDSSLRSAYVEVREKQSFDWPLVSCAVNLDGPGSPRVVLGAVAPIPWRLKQVEKLLAGQDLRELSDELLAKAKTAAVKDARPMTRNEYKVQLAGAALEHALRTAYQIR